jgi:hypothetical protein
MPTTKTVEWPKEAIPELLPIKKGSRICTCIFDDRGRSSVVAGVQRGQKCLVIPLEEEE